MIYNCDDDGRGEKASVKAITFSWSSKSIVVAVVVGDATRARFCSTQNDKPIIGRLRNLPNVLFDQP